MKIKTAGDERWVKQIGMHQNKYYIQTQYHNKDEQPLQPVQHK